MVVASDALRMRVLGVAGSSDTGKTTTVERLVAALSSRGRVATVKSIHHDVTPDQPGKDTHRHREAGANRVVGVAPNVEFEVRDGGKRAAAERTGSEVDALRSTLGRLGHPDFVLVEGFSGSLLPKVVTDDRAVGGRVVGRRDDALDALTAAAASLVPYPTVDGVRQALASRRADRDVNVDTDGDRGGSVVGAGAFSTSGPVARSADEWTSRDALPAGWDAGGSADGGEASRNRDGGDRFDAVEGASVAVRPPLRDPEPAVVTVGAAADDAEAATAAVVDAGRELARRWSHLSPVPDRVAVG